MLTFTISNPVLRNQLAAALPLHYSTEPLRE